MQKSLPLQLSHVQGPPDLSQNKVIGKNREIYSHFVTVILPFVLVTRDSTAWGNLH